MDNESGGESYKREEVVEIMMMNERFHWSRSILNLIKLNVYDVEKNLGNKSFLFHKMLVNTQFTLNL